MNPGIVLTPVRYGDVSEMISRRAFYKTHRKIVSDIYLHEQVADDPAKITDALLMRCPHGVLRGFAALQNRSFTLNLDDWMPIISIPRGSPPVATASGRIVRLVERDIVTINGRRSVTAVQSMVDIFTTPDGWGRWRDGALLEEQVALTDHLLRQNQDLLAILRRDPRTKTVASLANPLAESRPESMVRVRLHQAGLTSWKPQIKVRGRDKFYFVDLGDPLLRVGIEYQGAHHFDREERAADAQRANDLSWAGWTIMEVTSVILSSDVKWQRFLNRVREEVVLAGQERNRRIS